MLKIRFILLFFISTQSLLSYELRPKDYFADVGFGFNWSSGKSLYKAKNNLHSSLKLGRNITSQFSLFYFDVSSSREHYFDKRGATGIGSTYYFSPTVKSFYLTFSYGQNYCYSCGSFSYYSPILIFGFGYQLSNRYYFDLTSSYTDTEGLSSQFVFNRIFY